MSVTMKTQLSKKLRTVRKKTVGDVVKSCADEFVDALDAKSCVVRGVDEAEANA